MIKRYTTQTNEVGDILLFDGDEYFADIEYKSSEDAIVGRLNEQDQKIKKLEAQLYCDAEGGVCEICKNQYLEKYHESAIPTEYYIAFCKKGHKECSSDTLKYCEDFEMIL